MATDPYNQAFISKESNNQSTHNLKSDGIKMYEGYIDRYNRDFIEGWGWDNRYPDTSIILELFNDGDLISRVDANKFRIDLYSLKMGNGEHGFYIKIPDILRDGKDHIIGIQYEKTGLHVSGSPIRITTEKLESNTPENHNWFRLPKSSNISDPPLPGDLQAMATKKIRNLGEILDRRYAGIFSVIPDQDVVDLYLHDEFRSSGASDYNKRTTNPAYYLHLMEDLIQRLESFQSPRGYNLCKEKVKILDIGSGSGNSIIPIIHFFNNSRIIASDLSPDMLLLMKNNLPSDLHNNNLMLMQLNAEDLAFQDNSFDYIFGFSILHHLFSPEITLRQCNRVLKNNAFAVFFEPFESGYQSLRDVFEKILSDPRSKFLPPEIVNMLNAHVLFFNLQKGSDKSLPCYKHIEDKWVFTEKYFKDVAQSCGFLDPVIYNINPSGNPLKDKVRDLIKIVSGGNHNDPLMDWAWEIVHQYEMNLPENEKRSLLFEGCIILQKGGG